MPVKTTFLGCGGEEFWLDENDFLIWKDDDGVEHAVLAHQDLADFSEWLAAEVAKRKLPEDQEQTPWDAYPIGEWIEYDGSGERQVPENWVVWAKLASCEIGESCAMAFDWGRSSPIEFWQITHFKIISKA